MARYVMSNRRAGRFDEADKRASRGALSAALSMMPPDATLMRDNAPADDVARRTVMFEAEPADVLAMRAVLPADVIIEPEILHHRLVDAPADFLDTDPLWRGAPVAGGDCTLDVVISGGGTPLAGAGATLFLRGAGGLRRQLAATSDAAGRAGFRYPAAFAAAALTVVPVAGFWSMSVRGPGRDDGCGAGGDTLRVDCPPLPAGDAVPWWHDVVGASRASRRRGRGIRVGVIDSGVGPHPALEHVSDIGSFVDGVFDPAGGADSGSHGSHVNGIVGARPVEDGGHAGVSPGVRQFSARVFPPEGGANQMDISDAIDALSREHAVDLINLSLGAPVGSEIERDAILDALERGTLCICAAGNSNGPVGFPAAFPETVAVAALGLEGWGPPGSLSASRLPSAASRFGEDGLYVASFSDTGPEITVAAPGVGIVSTVPATAALAAPYAVMDGTSMASPLACGALAARLASSAAYRALPRDGSRAAFARRLLLESARDVGLGPTLQGRGVPSA